MATGFTSQKEGNARARTVARPSISKAVNEHSKEHARRGEEKVASVQASVPEMKWGSSRAQYGALRHGVLVVIMV